MKKFLILALIAFLAACAQTAKKDPTPAPAPKPAPAPVVKKPPTCTNCATVTAIVTHTPEATTASTKPVLGGLVGGVVSTTQKDQAKPRSQYKVSVRMDSGETRTIIANSISANMRVGSKVMVQGDRITLLR
jgi:uncharacterized lipoprotein YajG